MAAPRLDKRTRHDVLTTAVEELAPLYVPDWTGVSDPASPDPGRRLVELFARLAELLIERLNRMPEKNFLSFLELAGVERFPGAPAEAPVSFVLSKRAVLGGLVPAGTQVATTQTERSDALVFETRHAFFATPAVLEKLVALVPGADAFVQLAVPPVPPELADLETVAPVSVFDPDEPALRPADHVFYIGSKTLFSRKDAIDVTIILTLDSGVFPEAVTWRRFDEAADEWTELPQPVRAQPSASEVHLTFQRLAGVGGTTVDGVEDHWLAAHFVGDFDAGFAPPVISKVEASVAEPSEPLAAFDAAFSNAAPIDQSRPYHPFGRRPAYADAFYFASDVAFGPDIEFVTLRFRVRPYTTAEIVARFDGVPSTTVATRARWQFLDAAGAWQDLAEFEHRFVITTTSAGTTVASQSVLTPPGGPHASEGTLILGQTNADQAELLLAGFQDLIGPRPVHGVTGHWLRVLLVSDEPYGNDGALVNGTSPRFIGPLFFPPIVEDVEIHYVPRTAPVPVTNLKTLNNFVFADHAGPGAPFRPYRSLAARRLGGFPAFGTDPALYLGFDRPFGTVSVSLFFDLARRASLLESPLEAGNPGLAWEYWSAATGWSALDVADDTLDLTTSGTVRFVGPDDTASVALFPQLVAGAAADPAARWWFRARLAIGRYDHPPALRGVYLNTVVTDNHSTVGELLVGSSNGEPGQVFPLVKGPVLAGELWVREPELPSDKELEGLEEDHGGGRFADPDAPAPGRMVDVREVEGGGREVWVRWRRTATFDTSRPRSRHYSLDSVAAVVRFGDGRHGLIPFTGRNNIVLRGLRTGGGEAAQREAGPLAIKELKTSLPFIDQVFNVQGATAGASPWTLAQLADFGPQMLKNRGRPVTTEDFELMVRQRFSHVARVRCLPTRAPAPGGGLAFKAGAVTALVVPRSAERRPQPDPGLIRRIREFLGRTALANIGSDIHVKGPDYVAVSIHATLVGVLPELASVVVRKATAALEALLHPLTGGEDRTGYGFGRPVYLSEVQAVLERIEEVDHVVRAEFENLPAGADPNEFPIGSDRLASSGIHVITV